MAVTQGLVDVLQLMTAYNVIRTAVDPNLLSFWDDPHFPSIIGQAGAGQQSFPDLFGKIALLDIDDNTPFRRPRTAGPN